jgi:hypothetical protein
LQRPPAPQVAPAAQGPPPPLGQRYVYHSHPQHYSKMLLKEKILQHGRPSDRHVVSVFPFSLDRLRTHADGRTRSPRLYTANTRCLAQSRCLSRHFEEQRHTLVMTTFRFDLHHANFVNVPKQRFFRRYWTFTQPVDVFTYELVNGVMVISMCGGTSSDRQIIRIVLQDNMTDSSLTTSHKNRCRNVHY